MAQDRFAGYPAAFVHSGGTLNLRQLSGIVLDTAKQRSEIAAAGMIDRAAVILSHAQQNVRITTDDIVTVAGAISQTAGLKLTGAGTTLRVIKRLNGGALDTTGTTVTNGTDCEGFICLDSIQADQDDTKGAVCELMYYPLWNGPVAGAITAATLPLVVTNAVDFSAVNTPLFTSKFYLGPVYLGSTKLEGVKRHSVKFGIGYQLMPADGDPWARTGAIYTRKPVIEIDFWKTTAITSSAIFSAALADTLKIYYWKGVHGGSRVNPVTTVHTKITTAAAEWGTDNVQFSEVDDTTIRVSIYPTDTLTLSVASAIP